MYFYIVVHPRLEHYYIYNEKTKAIVAMENLNTVKGNQSHIVREPYEVIVVEEGEELQGIIDYTRLSVELQNEYMYTKIA